MMLFLLFFCMMGVYYFRSIHHTRWSVVIRRSFGSFFDRAVLFLRERRVFPVLVRGFGANAIVCWGGNGQFLKHGHICRKESSAQFLTLTQRWLLMRDSRHSSSSVIGVSTASPCRVFASSIWLCERVISPHRPTGEVLLLRQKPRNPF